jgi:type IV pilus assembly protein PilF
MQTKHIIVLLVIITWLLSCASSGGNNRKSRNISRTENLQQAAPGSAEMINLELGVGYLKRGREGDRDTALMKFKKAIAINPEFALAHSMIAHVYDRMGLFDSAKKHYKLSLKYNNNSPDIINNYANFLCQRGSFKLAIEKYLEVVNNPQYKTPASAYENAGVCAKKANINDKAEEYFRQALSINAKQVTSLYYMMLIYLDKKEYMKARAFLQRLESVVRPSAEMLAAGYQVEKGLNNENLAKKYLTTLKSEFPDSQSLKNIQ